VRTADTIKTHRDIAEHTCLISANRTSRSLHPNQLWARSRVQQIEFEERAAFNRKQCKKESENYYKFTTVRGFYSLGGA
jgi:hypothetical protein